MLVSKYAIITGATGGIGKAIAIKLIEDGYDLILISRSQEGLLNLKDELHKILGCKNIKIQSCDISDYHSVGNLFKEIKSWGINISVLVNCAGISGGGITSEIDNELWIKVINTNLNGAFFVTKEMLRNELMQSGGRIINIASTGGKQGVIRGAPYSASKHGLVGFTKALGLELARNKSGITVNAVCPGFVETEMAERVRKHYSKIWDTTVEETKRRIEERVPLGRYVIPSEVAEMVSYIASPQASAVTAQAINICGGLGNY
jgi:ketoreductase